MQKNQGDPPYAFICYSRDDYDSVEPIVRSLRKDQYSVWFDGDMIEDGRTRIWADIANRISNCAVFIAFHSETSVNSEWCSNEIDYAHDKKKPILRVNIHNVSLNPGQDFLLKGLHYISHESTETTVSWLKKTQLMSRCKCSHAEVEFSEEDEEIGRNPVQPVAASQEDIAITVWQALGDDKTLAKGRPLQSLDELEMAMKSNNQQTLYSSEYSCIAFDVLRRRNGIASDVLYRRNGFDFTSSGIAFRHKSLPFPSEHWTSWSDFVNPQNLIAPKRVQSTHMTEFQQDTDFFRVLGVAITIILCFCFLFACLSVIRIGPVFISLGLALVLALLGYCICRENIKYTYIFVLLIQQTQEEKGIFACKEVEKDKYDRFLRRLRSRLSGIMTATEKSDG